MMYTITCLQCAEVFTRAEFRRRGGGVHVICAACRKKDKIITQNAKQKVKKLRERYVAKCQAEERAAMRAQIKQDFYKATYENLRRLAKLRANPRPTKRTKTQLELRESLQNAWEEGRREALLGVGTGNYRALGAIMVGRGPTPQQRKRYVI